MNKGFDFRSISEFSNFRAVFYNGVKISPCIYTVSYYLPDDYYLAFNPTCFVIYDNKGKLVLSKVMTVCFLNLRTGDIHVNKNNKYGIFSYDGKVIVPVEFDSVYEYFEGYKVEKNGFVGYYSSDSKIVIPTEFFEISIEEDNNIYVQKGKYSTFEKY